MKYKTQILGVILAVLLPGFSAFPETIHPGILYVKDWLTSPGDDGLDNGMRKSVTYSNVTHQISGATVEYNVMQSSAIARTLKFISEYYLTYQSDLSSEQSLSLYDDIKKYAEQLLRHRKYTNGWGWVLTDPADLANENLEPNKFYSGGMVTASTYTMFTALGNAFACEGMVAASKVAALRGDTALADNWLGAAVLLGDFLCRLADPYDYYRTKFGAYCMVDDQGNPIEKPGMVYGLVTSQETLQTEIELQNLYAIVALKDLSEATGIQSYCSKAFQIRDQMCVGLNDFYQGYYPKYSNNGASVLSTNDFADNAWHAPILSGAPQVGDDNIEYALAALWQFHELSSTNYTFVYTNDGAKTFDMSVEAARFQDAPSAVMANDYSSQIERPDAAPLTVYYNGGGYSSIVNLNQTTNSSQWNLVGTYYLTSGTGNSVLLRATDSGIVVADAVKFELAADTNVSVIVDNITSAPHAFTKTGFWPTATNPSGFYGANYAYNAGLTGDVVRWRPSIDTAGTYNVYTRWPEASYEIPNPYDSCISFSGYFRKDNGVWKAWMPYYDIVGFGLLGAMRNEIYHTDYVNAWQRVVKNKVESNNAEYLVYVMLNSDLDVYWASNNQTAMGTLCSVAIGLSLLEITPYETDSPVINDKDRDGLPDWWEAQYFGGVTNANPASMTSNGVNTVREAYIAGFDPIDPAARFQVDMRTAFTSQSVLEWNTTTGRVYSVYWTADLFDEFQLLESNLAWTVRSFTNTVHNETSGFYRIYVEME